jgi:uncharacterized repeat protein (TIGR01451 family)
VTMRRGVRIGGPLAAMAMLAVLFGPVAASAGAASVDTSVTADVQPGTTHTYIDDEDGDTSTITVTPDVNLDPAGQAVTVDASFLPAESHTGDTVEVLQCTDGCVTLDTQPIGEDGTYHGVVNVSYCAAGCVVRALLIEDDDDTVDAPISFAPPLTTSIVGTPEPVTAGNDVQYTITVNNPAGVDVAGVSTADALPAGTTFVSSSSGCTGTGPVTCALGTVPAGGSASATVVVQTTAAQAGSTITDTATTSPDGSTGSVDSHVVVPVPGTVSGFVTPGGAVNTGGTNPTNLSLPNTGNGGGVTITQGAGNFCNGACVGPVSFVSSFPGYVDPYHPIDLKMTFAYTSLVKAASDFAVANIYQSPDGSAPGLKLADCKDNPAWTSKQKALAAARRLVRLGTQSGIAIAGPCVDSRSITATAWNQWTVTFEVLYLSGDPGNGKR